MVPKMNDVNQQESFLNVFNPMWIPLLFIFVLSFFLVTLLRRQVQRKAKYYAVKTMVVLGSGRSLLRNP